MFAKMTNKDSTSNSGDSFCLQISTNSSLSCESDLSSFSFDKEVETFTNRIDADELPAFEIRLLSPLGRSPSPIDSDLEFFSSPNKSCITPTKNSSNKKSHGNYKDNNEDFVTLHDINAQISPPSDSESSTHNISICDSPLGDLETIFEGVFLNTPPKKLLKKTFSNINKRSSWLEKLANKNQHFGGADKENVNSKNASCDDDNTTTTSTTTDDG